MRNLKRLLSFLGTLGLVSTVVCLLSFAQRSVAWAGEDISVLRAQAEKGDAAAQDHLGVLYDNGQGVPQDYGKAYKWLILAKAAGDSDAPKGIDLLMPLMTPDQIAEGQRLAREWTSAKTGSVPNVELFESLGNSSPDLSGIKNMLEAQNQEIAALKSGKERLEKSTPHYSSLVDHPSFNLPKHQSWYAVVVGVEQYPKGIPPAEFSARDAQAVKANLIALGYPESHIRVLKDEQATNAGFHVS